MKKKSTKKKSASHMGNLRAVIALLIILLALSVLLLFRQYQQNIFSSGMFNVFLSLCVIGFSLLIALLFLINPKK